VALSEEKRIGESILVAYGDQKVGYQLKRLLVELGFLQITQVTTHGEAIDRANLGKYTHVFFDSRDTDISPHDFIQKMTEQHPESGLIAIASSMDVDGVFTLLQAGARSFLVVPFTFEAIEQSLRYAGKEFQINTELINDPNRASTLAEVVLTNFNMLARLQELKRKSPKSFDLQQLIIERKKLLRESVEVAKTGTPGGAQAFVNQIVEKCLAEAYDPTSRLGRVRKKLRQERLAQNLAIAKPTKP
jgi:DNA-binding NtrC family response regulator